jgi:proteasome lid subunit RPN8/RPN11
MDWIRALLDKLGRALGGNETASVLSPELSGASAATSTNYRPLQRLRLTEAVSQMLFDEYEAHQRGARSRDETGWILLGIRGEDEALALATIPAGIESEAGEAHVRFNSNAQAVASRFVRQHDRRLTMLGVVHTHPGSLRHPSDGDYRGDVVWVNQLRGAEGVFGIGTIEDPPQTTKGVRQPRPNTQIQGGHRFTWYSLRSSDRNYRPLEVVLEPGPDLATSLRRVWPILEANADRLDNLAQQLARVKFSIADGQALTVTIPLPNGESALRAVVGAKSVHYFLIRSGTLLTADIDEPRIDRAIFQLLAELAGTD